MLPPGSMGLPLLGETLSFARNPYSFIESRIAAHGPVFKTNILFKKTVVLSGPGASGQFIDETLVMREGSTPPPIRKLFGGKILPFLDGSLHKQHKEIVLQAFDTEALSCYLPQVQKIVEDHFKEWFKADTIAWVDELRHLSFESIATNVVGMSRGPEMDEIRKEYYTLLPGVLALPVSIPGTTFWKARKAENKALAMLQSVAAKRKQSPGQDGISRMLTARSQTGQTLTVEEAAHETHHAFMAGLIIFAELVAIVIHLTDNPRIKERLQGELKAIDVYKPPSLEDLDRLHYMEAFVKEVKRLCKVIFGVFGKARKDFQIGDLTVPKGWSLLWAIPASDLDPTSFADPQRFDPDRFLPERWEDRKPCAFVPQGSGPPVGHRCAGIDYSAMLMKLFTITLLRDCDWELPPQDLSYNWLMNPPQPRSGLQARIRPRMKT